jgi:hypothetical protein
MEQDKHEAEVSEANLGYSWVLEWKKAAFDTDLCIG